MFRFLFVVLAVLTLAGCGGDGDGDRADMDMTGDGDAPVESTPAMRWWNALTAEQMVAELYGDAATDEQAAAAQKMYADLDDDTRALVDAAAAEIYGMGDFDSLGDWWESLDCRLMRIAAGDGNTADPMSPYCTHYPGSGAEKILSRAATAHVNEIGRALLDYADMMAYTPADMAAFDELVEGMTVVFTFEGGFLAKLAFTGPGQFYSFDDPNSPGEFPGEFTWEYLDDDTYSGRLSVWWVLDDPEAYLFEVDMMFTGMHEGLFWSDYSESGESVTVSSGTFEIMETEDTSN